jgi:mono/diheme cytochrome c family protein
MKMVRRMRMKRMSHRVLLVASAAFLCTAAWSGGDNLRAAARQTPALAAGPQRILIDSYCLGCHNQRAKIGGLALDTMDLSDVSKNADVWEKAVRKLRGSQMPPPGARRPDAAQVETFITALETALDQAAVAHPNPGRVALHRLNRTEYANAIEDLLAVRVDPSALLPKDDEADGFDNVASVLSVSPAFLDQYISAARVVSARALGTANARPTSITYRPSRGTDQTARIEGLPLGTRGGMLVEHLFPVDGDYKLTVTGLAIGGYVRGMEYKFRVIATVDGAKVFESHIGGEEDLKAIDQQQAPAIGAINARFQNIPVTVKAGPHKVGVTFVARTFAESDDVLYAFRPGLGEERVPKMTGLQIAGPFTTAGLGDTPGRQRVFVCRPANADDQLPCATKILSTLARRAYRRPVTDQDLAAPMTFYKEARAAGSDFEAAIESAMPTILASPKFLYRAERSPANVAPGTIHKITDLELASRLSFFLTSRSPDDELIGAAEHGSLSDPQGLEAQVRRLLKDPRSHSLVTNFAFQWLKMRGLDEVDPDAVVFPNFDDSLRDGFRKEIELFVGSIFEEDRSIVDLLTADYTYLNERLARHYGIPNILGERYRRVTLTDPNRWGLLGKGGVLMTTSYANRTAPVIRGAWILENVLGTPPAAPPPNVEGFKENKDGEKAKTVREIMEQHRANATCNACHGVMDPLGFALENFDAIGEWRTQDRFAGTPIDASGTLIDGTKVGGTVDLRNALAKHPAQFAQTVTEKLMTYALGRSVEYYDMPVIRAIVRDAARENYRFSSIVTGIVKSAPFQMRKTASGESVGN